MLARYAVSLMLVAPMAAYSQCSPVDCSAQLPAWGGLCSESFMEGRVGQPYVDVVSFHVTNACTPAELFNPDFAGASVRITLISSISFAQLPGGITGSTNQATYTPPANGCGSLGGIPTEAGVFPVTVDMVANVNAWPFSATCGGFGPVAQNNNPVSFERPLVILPDPAFLAPDAPLCITDGTVTLTPTGTPGGVFSGPGITGDSFDPAAAGVGMHEVKYVVSAQQGAAVAPATDSLSVFIEVNADCLGDCDAFAGTLGGVDFIPCLEPGGSVELVGIPGGDAIVPDGFEVFYVLTQGAGLIIVDGGPSPVFSVTEPGPYAIHTLVYDPATLDLGEVEFGTTTGAYVHALLLQGGGDLCGSLDLVGAAYVVVECAGPCVADAGTMIGGGTACLEGGEATLSASPNGDAIIPLGFLQAYVLTQGASFTMLNGGLSPVFTVTEVGSYAVHSFVFDPSTFDPGQLEPGVTTADDVLALIAANGLCADLDAEGAVFVVELCNGIGQMSGSGFVVFPNPSSGHFSLLHTFTGAMHVELIDLSGRVADRQVVSFTSGNAATIVTGVSPGSYLLRITGAAGRWEQRLSIQR